MRIFVVIYVLSCLYLFTLMRAGAKPVPAIEDRRR